MKEKVRMHIDLWISADPKKFNAGIPLDNLLRKYGWFIDKLSIYPVYKNKKEYWRNYRKMYYRKNREKILRKMNEKN